MTSILQQVESFAEYARCKLQAGESPGSIDDLYDQWRESLWATEDAAAIAASLRDFEQGERGKTFEAFATEFSGRNGMLESP